MTTKLLLNLLLVLLLGTLSLRSPAQAPAEEAAPRITRTEDGRSVLSFSVGATKETDYDSYQDPYQAAFDFGKTKGLGEGDAPVVNDDRSLIAVTNFPATKTSYVHLFIRQPSGDLTVINTFNRRAAKLLEGRWAKAAESRLEATSITGRIVELSVYDYVFGKEPEEHCFRVVVGENGTLTLAK